MNVEPYRVEAAEDELSDLRQRLERARFSPQIPGSGWTYGTDGGYLQQLCQHWAKSYDWRRTEAQLNEWDQYLTVIDGQRFHFIHARSPEPDAVPLLLVHGYPGSVLEFLKILGPLVDPARYGGDPRDAFHVVAPSLPGYTWSGPTTEPGWDAPRIASAFETLMEGLGYATFAAQGGDWGSMITTALAASSPQKLLGLHLNMMVTAGPSPDDGELTEDETALLASWQAHQATEEGYVAQLGTKPQTIGYGLDDSPVGLAAWVVEKLYQWTDCDGDLESVLDKDEILGGITAYWLTRTASSAGRLYYEQRAGDAPLVQPERIEVPTAFASFRKELYRPSRRWAERHYNIQQWSELGRGGHFAALERPEALVADMRTFFRRFR